MGGAEEKFILECGNKMFRCIKNCVRSSARGRQCRWGVPAPSRCCHWRCGTEPLPLWPPWPLPLCDSKPTWCCFYAARHGVVQASCCCKDAAPQMPPQLSHWCVGVGHATTLCPGQHACWERGPGHGDLNLPLCENEDVFIGKILPQYPQFNFLPSWYLMAQHTVVAAASPHWPVLFRAGVQQKG